MPLIDPQSIVPLSRVEPQVNMHEVGFVMRVHDFNGAPPNSDDSQLYRAMSGADDKLYRDLQRAITNCHYVDHYEVECDRLDVCEPEYDHDDALPEGAVLYKVTLQSSKALPLNKQDTNEDNPISIEQLVEEVPAALQSIYAAAGVTMSLHRVTWYQRYESSAQGEYKRA